MNPPEHIAERAADDEATAEAAPDPYQQLDDLMCVVEQFCPVWPERGISRTNPDLMRL